MGQTHNAKRLAYLEKRTDARDINDPVRRKRNDRRYNAEAKAEGRPTLAEQYRHRSQGNASDEAHLRSVQEDNLGMDLSSVKSERGVA